MRGRQPFFFFFFHPTLVSFFTSFRPPSFCRYTDTTSQWTLDYPPLFAWFQRGLAGVARIVAPDALTLSAGPVDSRAIAAFQRGSVVVTDGLLAAAAAGVTAPLPRPAAALTFGLLVCGPGLFLLDHIHFQYNGWLVGVLLVAVGASAAAGGGRGGGRGAPAPAPAPAPTPRELALTASGAGAYAALVCSKHLFAAVGPVFALYFAALALRAPGGVGGKVAAGAAVAAPVGAVLAAALLPLHRAGGRAALHALASRLAPLDRGLIHAYWAPNAWALAAGADGVGAALAKRVVAAGVPLPPRLAAAARSVAAAAAGGAGAFSSGLVQVTSFACFPTPGPALAAGAALAAQAPALAALALTFFPSPSTHAPAAAAAAGLLLPAVEFAGLSAAAWGYHVHEKAAVPYVLLAALGLGVAATAGGAAAGREGGRRPLLSIPPPPPGRPVARLAADPAHYATLALASTHALLPLIQGAGEWGVRTAVAGAHAAVALGLVAGAGGGGSGSEGSSRAGGGGRWWGRALRHRAAALAVLLGGAELYASLLHALAFKGRLPFLPLAATSLACAAGLVGEWAIAGWAWVGEARAAAATAGGGRARASTARRKRGWKN
jgi:alpha-1,3-glucosyltransferase